MIPKVIHYIFGLREDFCGKPFTDFHYLNIVSAWKLNPDYKIKVVFGDETIRYAEPNEFIFL